MMKILLVICCVCKILCCKILSAYAYAIRSTILARKYLFNVKYPKQQDAEFGSTNTSQAAL